jgi:hypothetical protein
MPNIEFTEEMCEAIFRAPKKLASQIEWFVENPNTFRFEAKVICESQNLVLDLNGHWCHNTLLKRRRWGFALKLGGYAIRSYDMSKKHKNFGIVGKRVRGPHKHRFKMSKIARFAYSPDPPISDTDPNQSLMDFLTEAHIELPAEYQSVMFP